MVFLDRKFRIRNFTPPAKPLFRLRDHDVGRPLDELAGPLNYADLKTSVAKVIKEGKAKEREVELNGGGKRTYIMRVLPYRDEREKIQGAVLAFIDITERKRSETRLATMVSELNHRVKNALASVQAMVRQTGTGAKSVPDCVETIEGRLQAMAAAHNLLSAAQWEHVDLGELADQTLAPFAEPGAERLRSSGPHIELHAGCAVSIAMILHELATNAAKYGAWSTPEGRVAVRWEIPSEAPESLLLAWDEKGGPAAVEPEKSGFGLRFIQRSVAHELRGECRPAFGPEGFTCRFKLPIERIRWVPGESAAADA
jgi:two-component system CheB/CheR fusion protein